MDSTKKPHERLSGKDVSTTVSYSNKSELHKDALESGEKTINQIRAELKMPPIGEMGDVRYRRCMP